jgi:hypothetical protein
MASKQWLDIGSAVTAIALVDDPNPIQTPQLGAECRLQLP